jgi:uncharacterized protein (DUF2062 family)
MLLRQIRTALSRRTTSLAAYRRNGVWARFERVVRYRLFIPLKRNPHPPEHTARGVMIGIAWAMTPTVGIQMPLVLGTWLLARRLLRWDFSLLAALAWTWITNVFTLVPTYYVFFLTGQVMRGRVHDLAGYDGFLKLWHAVEKPSIHSWDSIVGWFGTILQGWGVSMLVGCVPWAIASAWIGYVWSLAFVRRYRARRAAKSGPGGQIPAV